MNAAWTFLLNVLATMPAWLAAGLVGWALSIGTTQALKFLMPMAIDYDGRELTTRLVAFFSAFLASGFHYAGAPDAGPADLILVMVGTGLWSPIAYALLIAFLRRSPRLSWIADVLSQDKRGVVASKLRGRQ